MTAALVGVRGVLFDKDGTLFDFQKSWGGFGARIVHALAEGDPAQADALAAAARLDLATERYAADAPIAAGAVQELIARWIALLPGWTPERLTGFILTEARVMAEAGLSPATDDLPALLRRLAASGLALGVATHDVEDAARAHLERAGALSAIQFLAAANSGYALKPDPAMLRAFCAQAGLAPGEVVVVGDSVEDLRMGREGGARAAIGVLTGPADAARLAPYADHILPSIAELPTLLGLPD